MLTKFIEALTRRAPLAAAIVAAAGAATSGLAETDWPTEPLTLMVATKPGGSMDRFGRAMAPYLEEELGQPIKIINKGPSLVGHTAYLAQEDGNMLIASTPYPFQVMNILTDKANYTLDDFAFLNAQWVDYPVLYVHKDSPYQTAKEFVEELKNNPEKVATGVVPGSIGHVLSLKLMQELGADESKLRIVTYGGGGPKRTAFAGHQIDFGIEPAQGSQAIADYLRPLAVFLDEPSPDYPGVPTMNEVLAEYNVTLPTPSYQFLSLGVSKAFQEKYPERFEKLIEANKRILEKPEVQAALKEKDIGFEWRGPERTKKMLVDGEAFLRDNLDMMDRGSN